MACTKVLARDWTIEVYDEDAEAGEEWTSIAGINTFTLSSDKESTETTTFDSEGFGEHLASERNYTLSFDGYYDEDDEGVRDAGQELVETLGEAVGCDAYAYIHLKSPNGGKEKYFEGTINLSDIGGGTNDSTTWGFELEVNGKPSDTEIPTE